VPDTKINPKGIGEFEMSNIFAGLRTYAGKWMEKSRRTFSAEEINAVESASVVNSTYGLSVCFMMKTGGQTFIPLSNTSSKGVGESVDLNSATLVTLGKQGEADIIRVEV
jgi:hypothetical protein